MTYVCKDCGHLASEHNIDGCGFKHCSCVKLCVPVTQRELSVWKGIASGKTVKDLATALFLSVKTVDSHLWNLHQKLGVHNRTQLTILALSLGLIEPADIPTPNVSVALPVPASSEMRNHIAAQELIERDLLKPLSRQRFVT